MTEVISLSLSTGLKEMIDKARGDVARSRFIVKTLEDALHVEYGNKMQSLARRRVAE